MPNSRKWAWGGEFSLNSCFFQLLSWVMRRLAWSSGYYTPELSSGAGRETGSLASSYSLFPTRQKLSSLFYTALQKLVLLKKGETLDLILTFPPEGAGCAL